MKRCPECRRDYYDDSLLFCLDDGHALLEGPKSEPPASAGGQFDNEPATAILHETEFSSGEVQASSLPYANDQTRVFKVDPWDPNKPPQGATRNNSIAVLPFVNISADAENEYFCDGLAEELLNALAKIDNLKVAARTASFSFRGKNAPMGEIGRVLNVNSILEGSVRKAGNRVRITIQLISAADGYHLWSERYDRDMQDIFEIQDEITLAVVDALKLRLLAPEKRAILKRHTDDAEAYQLYLRGRFFFYKRTPEGFLKAIECFEMAIEIDKDYAVAISGLADSYIFLGFYEMVPPSEASAKLRTLVKRAIEIDDTLAETNTSYALMMTLFDWDHRGSLRYFEKALAADPKYPIAHHLESAVTIVLGENERSFAAEKRAIEIDPFTPVFNASLAWWYYIGGRNNDAIVQAKRTIEIAPNHFFAYWVLGLAFAIEGAYADGVVAFQQALTLNQFEVHIRADLARVFGEMGEKEEAIGILTELEEMSVHQYVSPVNIAKIYAGLGEDGKVFEQLEKACKEMSVRLPWFMVDPVLVRFRSDPRYLDIKRRIGLTD